MLQACNATIQEGLFEVNEAAVNQPQPWVYQHKLGLAFVQNRVTINLGYIYQTKETRKQYVNHRYASLKFNYRFN